MTLSCAAMSLWILGYVPKPGTVVTVRSAPGQYSEEMIRKAKRCARLNHIRYKIVE